MGLSIGDDRSGELTQRMGRMTTAVTVVKSVWEPLVVRAQAKGGDR